LSFLFINTVYADNDWARYRLQFQEAKQALDSGDIPNLTRLQAEIQDYPIAYYFEYQQLIKNVATENPATLADFLKRFPNTVAADKLRTEWLLQLAKQKDWTSYLKHYTPQKEKALQCNQMVALLQIQKNLPAETLEQAKELWTSGVVQKDCDLVFKYLQNNKLLSNELTWQRIVALMTKGQAKVAGEFGKTLSKELQTWLGHWQQMLANPAAQLKKVTYPHEPPACDILLHGIKQLSKKDANSAYQFLKKAPIDYQCAATARQETLRTVVLAAVDQNLPTAISWFLELEPQQLDETARQIQLQLVLQKQQWDILAKFIQQWADADQKTAQGQYWLARALEQTDQLDAAKKLYEQAAQDRSFYGFLAADRLKQPYRFNFERIPENPKYKQELSQNLAMIRAREFFLVGLSDEARSEWRKATENFKPEQLATAAQLAMEWNWHFQAIITANRANFLDDIELRFPTPFYDLVLGQADSRTLNPAWIYAVIRQESAFQIDARSTANALGLMQLLPSTAKELATREKLTLADEKDIIVPENNIRLGVLYLRQLLDKFDDNYVLATAAYNAGGSRVRNWLKEHGCVPMDVWIELIPFKETRKYVQAILSYMPIFEYRLTGNSRVNSMRVDPLDNDVCQGSV
jgi:soluble lytic murein transglycosylase